MKTEALKQIDMEIASARETINRIRGLLNYEHNAKPSTGYGTTPLEQVKGISLFDFLTAPVCH